MRPNIVVDSPLAALIVAPTEKALFQAWKAAAPEKHTALREAQKALSAARQLRTTEPGKYEAAKTALQALRKAQQEEMKATLPELFAAWESKKLVGRNLKASAKAAAASEASSTSTEKSVPSVVV